MNNIFTPSDIIWIKNVTNHETGIAYMDLSENDFVLHFPTHHKSNVTVPDINDIILVFQTIDKIRVFTHLVTPIDSKLIDENFRSRYRYGRYVKVIAKTDINGAIPISKTLWNKVNFQGISQGNVCKIENVKKIRNIEELQLDIWNKFRIYFVQSEKESFNTITAALNDIENFNPDLIAVEGKLKLVLHLARERNNEIVKTKKLLAVQNNLFKCEVCTFSFKERYDAKYIECHHIFPIGKSGVRETRLEDLALVCSNCHRMLHSKFNGVYLTIEQLREKILKLNKKL